MAGSGVKFRGRFSQVGRLLGNILFFVGKNNLPTPAQGRKTGVVILSRRPYFMLAPARAGISLRLSLPPQRRTAQARPSGPWPVRILAETSSLCRSITATA